ncbi:hypothetical protein [Bacillus cereus]|uniref:hypothetical protein n=1 Tax=Bacillus cereus TaxID=1396 RepID=UPI000B4B2933|nr:hypothetical protein [Bacillus cereus]
MSKSKAKKLREKKIREGGLNAENSRSIYTKDKKGFQFTAERAGKTKKDVIYKNKYNKFED